MDGEIQPGGGEAEREREKGRYLMVDGMDDGKWIGG